MITAFERRLRDAAHIPFTEARNLWALFREREGYKRDARPLLTPPAGNTKLLKSKVPTYGLSLSPERESGIAGVNLCPFAGDCADLCLSHQGRAQFGTSQHARQTRTKFAWEEPDAFISLLYREVWLAQKRFGEIGFRPNVFSDVQWEFVPWTAEFHPANGIHMYDYTKFPPEVRPGVPWYDLTRSFNEKVAWADVVSSLRVGEKWAVVFNGSVPDFYKGVPVIDGDKSDERFLDPAGSLIGLSAKGTAKKSMSPFIVRPARTVRGGKVWAW